MDEYQQQSLMTYFHYAGTCRIGTDAMAVVDPDLTVRGVAGLPVADASVMPSIPSANTNATILAIAERAASLIIADRQASRDGATSAVDSRTEEEAFSRGEFPALCSDVAGVTPGGPATNPAVSWAPVQLPAQFESRRDELLGQLDPIETPNQG